MAIAPVTPLLLDTNVLIVYARAGVPSRRPEAQLGLQSGAAEGVIAVISVGEALAFARKRNWGQNRQDVLRELIRTRLVPIDVNRSEILEAKDFDHRNDAGLIVRRWIDPKSLAPTSP
jgi:tRNA(fMet)-specific endonuclease VapC